MRVVRPLDVTSEVLESTNVANLEPDWAAGTYIQDQRVVFDRRVFQVVAASTTDQPDVGSLKIPPTWVQVGFSNQWRMFTEGGDSLTTAEGEIDVGLRYGAVINTIAAIGLKGFTVSVNVIDPDAGVVFSQEKSLIDIGVPDWWEYFFLPYEQVDIVIFDSLPAYPDAVVNFVIEGGTDTDEVAVGRLVSGLSSEIGVAVYGTSIDINDFSIKERDGFGGLKLVPRRTIKIVDFDVRVPTNNIDLVLRALQRIAATPALYIGEMSQPSTVVFGVFTNVSQGITTPSISDLTLQVEEF